MAYVIPGDAGMAPMPRTHMPLFSAILADVNAKRQLGRRVHIGRGLSPAAHSDRDWGGSIFGDCALRSGQRHPGSPFGE